MISIVIDAQLRTRLLAQPGVTELRDESGQVIGRFVRLTGIDSTIPAELMDVSDEELERREASDRRFTGEEVLQRLREFRR